MQLCRDVFKVRPQERPNINSQLLIDGSQTYTSWYDPFISVLV